MTNALQSAADGPTEQEQLMFTRVLRGRRPRAARVASAVFVSIAAVVSPPVHASASTWPAGLAAGSRGESQSGPMLQPPSTVTATCATNGNIIFVGWPAVAHATSYDVWQSRTVPGGNLTEVMAGTTLTSYTAGALKSDDYWYQVVAHVGGWTSAMSGYSAQHRIIGNKCF